MIVEYITHNKIETELLGEKLAKSLPNGAVVCLFGDLGTGKTTLTRGVAKGLNIQEVVQSPTFNIMKIYLKGDRPLIHIDAYRLLDNDADIGLEEYIGYENGLTLIEWPMYIERIIPKDHINITLSHLGGDDRKVVIESKEEIRI